MLARRSYKIESAPPPTGFIPVELPSLGVWAFFVYFGVT